MLSIAITNLVVGRMDETLDLAIFGLGLSE
jgi:hypothetical protein